MMSVANRGVGASCRWALVALTAIASCAHGAGGPCIQWDHVSGYANASGPSQSIYVKTPLYASVTDQNGNFSMRGGYLKLRNHDREHPVYWTSRAAGQHERPLAPGEEEIVYLALYSSSGVASSADLSVEYCKQ